MLSEVEVSGVDFIFAIRLSLFALCKSNKGCPMGQGHGNHVDVIKSGVMWVVGT